MKHRELVEGAIVGARADFEFFTALLRRQPRPVDVIVWAELARMAIDVVERQELAALRQEQ